MARNKTELLLQQGAATLGVSLTEAQLKSFAAYLQELNQWGRRINLSSRDDDRDIILKDFLDSLTVLKFLPRNGRLMDLGSGAGFPGFPLKIVRPEIEIMLLEATRKKVFFLKEVQRALGLKGVEIRWSGEGRGVKDLWGSFDFVVSRAFGTLMKFATEGIVFLKKGGVLMAMKGKKGGVELDQSLSSLESLGLKLIIREGVQLPFLNHERILIGLKRG